MLQHVRLIPITILAASLLVGLKVGDIWSGVNRMIGVPSATAETQPQASEHGKPVRGAPTNILPAAAKAEPPTASKPAAEKAVAKPEAKPAAKAAASEPKAPASKSESAAEHAAAGKTEAPTQMAAAEAGSAAAPAMPPTQAAAPPPPPPTPPPPPRDPSTFSKSELELLQNLAKRRDALDAQAKDVEMREAVLAAAAKKVDEKIAELKKIQDKIQSLLIQHDEQDEKQLQSLVKVYQNMKPKDAARIFEKLDMPVLLDVVERMKERNLAPILADMDPAKAKAVTIELATQRKLPREMAKGG